MTEARIGRVHLRCQAPRGCQREALALRTRLVGTARTHLPGALRGAPFEDEESRVFVERLEVPLDFDPLAHDDVTVAVLWAGRVRRALAELGPASPGVRRFASTREFLEAALVELLERGSLSWVFEELDCGSGTVELGRFLAAATTRERVRDLVGALAGRPQLARAAFDALAPARRRGVMAALRGERVWGDWEGPGKCGSAEGRGGITPAGRPPGPGRDRNGGEADARGAGEDGERTPVAVSPQEWLATLRAAAASGAAAVRLPGGAPANAAPGRDAERLLPPAALAPEGAEAAPEEEGSGSGSDLSHGDGDVEGPAQPLSWWSECGGLVLLYPWLAEYLAAELPEPDPVPGLDRELARRLWALAALADERPADLSLDPLVRLLAGDDVEVERGEGPRRATQAAAAETGEQCSPLSRLAAALPGLEGSSEEYLRRCFLRRGALIEPLAPGTVGVALERGPIDPVLERLPYPLGPFRLPWGPLFVVGWRRA